MTWFGISDRNLADIQNIRISTLTSAQRRSRYWANEAIRYPILLAGGFILLYGLASYFFSGNKNTSRVNGSIVQTVESSPSQVEEQVKDFLMKNLEDKVRLDFKGLEPRVDIMQNPNKFYINLYNKTNDLTSVQEIAPPQLPYRQVHTFGQKIDLAPQN